MNSNSLGPNSSGFNFMNRWGCLIIELNRFNFICKLNLIVQ